MAWEPQPGPQSSAITARWVDELFFGGARGGGKSDFQVGYQLDGAQKYGKDMRGIMFRKTYPELEELQARAAEVFPQAGGQYKTQPSAKFPFSNCWYFPDGATVKMRYIEHERDYGRYHGHQYTHISFDEVTEYPTPAGLLKMLSTLRSPAGVPCTVRLTGNPGGPGHLWVKDRYIDPVQPYTPYTEPETGFTRLFVPSKLQDNQILLEKDPAYRARVLAATAGNDALRRAWLEGDWDIIAGAFFECFSRERHVIRPFAIPEDWTRFVSFDWGSAAPFSVGWWAVVGDWTELEDGVVLPRGALVRYREWYGKKEGQINVGLKLTAEDIGRGIAQRQKDDPKPAYGVADPATFKQDGGPSHMERIAKAEKAELGRMTPWCRADNRRVGKHGAAGGWDQMRSRLMGEDFGDPYGERPMIYCFETCADSIRTIPALQHDENRPEDVDTDGEDHAGDEWRYACMSRPYMRKTEKQEMGRTLQDGLTMNDLWNQRPKRSRI